MDCELSFMLTLILMPSCTSLTYVKKFGNIWKSMTVIMLVSIFSCLLLFIPSSSSVTGFLPVQ